MPSRRTVLRGGAAAALTVAIGTGTAAPAGAAPDRVPDRDALRAALEEVVSTGATAALARVDGYAGAWSGAAGVATLDPGRPASPAGRFRVGSITKTFTSTVVLQLVGEGRLGLQDPVEQWLPGVLPHGAKITLHHLLQHTSGVFDYTRELLASPQDVLDIRYRTFTPRQLVALVADRPLLFEPGTSWSYSSTNYILLGMIIERATGHGYGDQVTRRILRPLRLRDTEVPGPVQTIAGRHAHGYLPLDQDGQTVPLDITVFTPSAAGAAGEIISTTADLNRFYRALLRGALLGGTQLRQMLTTTGQQDYGLGIRRMTLPDGTILWGHEGGFPGYEAISLVTEDARRRLTVSVNPWLGDHEPALTDLVHTAFAGYRGRHGGSLDDHGCHVVASVFERHVERVDEFEHVVGDE